MEFAYPEDKGGGGNYDEPVGELEGDYVEEFAARAHYKHLAGYDKERYQQEAAAAFEMEGGALGGEGAGVEHVPELQEDEDGEEERELVGGEWSCLAHRHAAYLRERRDVSMLEVVEQAQKNQEEDAAYTHDGLYHRAVDYE